MSIYKPTSGVAFDIDGIVLDTGTEIWKIITNHYNIPWSIDAWKEYYIEKQLGIPIQDMRPIYEPVLKRTDLPIVHGADTALRRFYDMTKEPILFITARRPQFVDSAEASIKRSLGDIPIVVVATSEAEARLGDNSGHDKTAYLKDHGIGFFIDDHPHSWKSYMDAGVCIGTLDWPWTRDKGLEMLENGYKDKFVMFSSWKAIHSYLHMTVAFKNFVDNHGEIGT